MSEADSITKLPDLNRKAEILLRLVAASLVLPLIGVHSTAAAPLPRGERGVANGKALRGEPNAFFFALLQRKKNCRFGRKGLGVREGGVLSNWRGSAETGTAQRRFSARSVNQTSVSNWTSFETPSWTTWS
jgi:hypothetical protein